MISEPYITKLNKCREEINEIDNQLVQLLEQRMSLVKGIGQIKQHFNEPIYVPEVEEKKIKTLSEKTSYRGMVEVIWPVIMCYSRTLE